MTIQQYLNICNTDINKIIADKEYNDTKYKKWTEEEETILINFLKKRSKESLQKKINNIFKKLNGTTKSKNKKLS